MANLNKIVIRNLEQAAALPLDQNNLYEITDYPVGGITNSVMAAALTPTYNAFFRVGETFICTDTGTYTKGRAYRFTGTAWDLVTEYDSTPTENSTKPVTSGGVKSYVDGLVGDINTILESLL